MSLVPARDKLLFAVLLLFVGAFPLFPAAYVVGGKLESADDTGRSSAGWLMTDDVAPGDRIAVLVRATAGRRSWIREIRARVLPGAGHTETLDVLDSAWKDLEGEASSVLLTLEVPRELPLGPAHIVLDLDVQVQEQTGRILNTVYVSSHARADRLELPLSLRSATGRDARRMTSRGKAAVAWLVASLAMYALTRWGFRRVRIDLFGPGVRLGTAGGLVVLIFVIAATALAAVGQIAFITPIVATIVPLPSSLALAMAVLWVVGILVGMWAGLLARKQMPRWLRAKIRAVIGRPSESTYRSAGSTLPATLSREPPRCGAERLIAAIRDSGLDVQAKRRKLVLSCDGEEVVEIRTSRPPPWLPEELDVRVREDIDATPIIGELAKLYGPLEYKGPAPPSLIIEVPH